MSDHDNQQHTADSAREKPAETEQEAAAGTDGTITEEAISQVLEKKERNGDDPPSSNESSEPGDRPVEEEPTEVDADDLTLMEADESEEALPEDDAQNRGIDPVQTTGNDEVVTVTVNRLQELGELLKELNFREMIMRFGELQAELDALRDGIRSMRGLVDQVGVSFGEGKPDTQPVAALETAATTMEKAAEHLKSMGYGGGDSRKSCADLADQVMDSLKALKQSHRARLSMASDLSDLVESDVSNEGLASAALEFAVFLKEIDATSDLEAFEMAFGELKALHDEMSSRGGEGAVPEDMTAELEQRAAGLRASSQQLGLLRDFYQQGREILYSMKLNGNTEQAVTFRQGTDPSDNDERSDSKDDAETE